MTAEQLLALAKLARARQDRDDAQFCLDAWLDYCEQLQCSPTELARASGLSRQTIHNRRARARRDQQKGDR